jgi:N-methylhydantoinase B
MPERPLPTIDPVSFEVLNHRLVSITEEMGIQYMRCSGSNVLITGNDAATAIMQPDGSLVAVGPYIVTQGNVLPLIVDSTRRLCGDDVGIEDGDVFICNDPYLGAIHHPDFATVAPLFHADELIGWIGASGHQLDTGGMDPGGFSIKAVDVHQEGLRMPPVKLVERGRLREDVLRWILNQVRDPLVGLDVRGQVAALATGRRRLLELVAAWGVDTVTGVMERSIELAREKLARRLGELPDGVWREVQFIDHDGHAPEIYRIVCTMTKRGDRLTFDFTGTSPNARGLINCTYSGLQAAVLSAVYINLCWDTPWNRGVRDCIDIVSESGTVNNCTYPAPCAMATISAVIVTIDAAWRCLAQLLLASDKYSEQAMAVWSGTSLAPIFAGTSQHGFPFAATEMSHFGGGGGARTYADGVDTAGIVFNTTPNMPNIEDQEAEYPVLYLFRRHLRDSGGPGRFRGGRAGELAYTVYGAPEGRLEGLFAGTGAEMPNAIGLAGGMPGAAIRVARVSGTDLGERLASGRPLPAALDEIPGRHETLSCKHERTPIEAGDVWYHSWQAGGGYGDPLARDPERVAQDVARGAVSAEVAHDIYGVVLDGDGEPDAAATVDRRAAIRAGRLASAAQPAAGGATVTFAGRGRHAFGDALLVDFDVGTVLCGYCGNRHCAPGDNLLDHLRAIETPLVASGPVRGEDYDRGRFRLRQLVCGHCGGLVDVSLAFDGAPPPAMRIDRWGAEADTAEEPHPHFGGATAGPHASIGSA